MTNQHVQSKYKLKLLINLMSSTQTLIQMASSIQVKDVITFSINAEYLNSNFAIVKQCLIKIQELQGSLGQQKMAGHQFNERLKQVELNLKSNQQFMRTNEEKIKQLQGNVGDDFMKRMYGIEEKTKNMLTFDDTVSRLEGLNKFVTIQQFKETTATLRQGIEDTKKIKNQFERYVTNSAFEVFKESFSSQHKQNDKKLKKMTDEISKLYQNFDKTKQIINEANNEVKLNTQMIKQINFTQMMQRNRKFKEETDQKMNDLLLKMKKKVGNNELLALQQTMIQKLDKFLSENEKTKAEKDETKEALLFLQKRICDIQEVFAEKAGEDEKDALFSVKKWQCASCTKDLGKFEGRLGQYRPWSIFPCKELDPQKTGGFGYMSYLDKVAVKKAASTPQENNFHSNTERLNKTFYEKDTEAQKRGLSTARTNNLISNYGSEERGTLGLKQAYFRELKTERGDRFGKVFRVKKEASKPASEFQKIKEV